LYCIVLYCVYIYIYVNNNEPTTSLFLLGVQEEDKPMGWGIFFAYMGCDLAVTNLHVG
jgi:hypothetical protein